MVAKVLDINNVIFLNKILNSDMFKGGKNFFSDLTGALLVIGAIMTVVSALFTLAVSQIDALEEWGKHSKKVRKVFFVGVFMFLVSGIYKLVVEGYFGFNLNIDDVKVGILDNLRYYL